MRYQRGLWIVVGLVWLSGLVALPFLPNPSPVHWGIDGRPDRFGSPLEAALLLPFILTVLVIVLPLLPKLDPRGERYAAFAGTYRRFMVAIVIFLGFVQVALLLAGLGLPFDMSRLIMIGVGILIAVIGNELGRVQPNFFVGIRTPWTLADDEVWRRTHRVAGRAMLAAGVLAVVCGLFLPAALMAFVAVPAILLSAIYSVAYSYFCYRGLHRQPSTKG